MANFQLEFKFVMSIQILFKPVCFFCWLFLIPIKKGTLCRDAVLKLVGKKNKVFYLFLIHSCGETLLTDVGCSWNSSFLSLYSLRHPGLRCQKTFLWFLMSPDEAKVGERVPRIQVSILPIWVTWRVCFWTRRFGGRSELPCSWTGNETDNCVRGWSC